MPDVDSALQAIAVARRDDPLAPVTVLVPSHAAGLQIRRRLAEITPFAAVRFETLPRIAELLAAGHLAAAGRSPLARPIGDYVAEIVARESRGALEKVATLPGYARVLRQIFRRLRRGGIRSSADVQMGGDLGHLPQVLRLFDLFRERTRDFYDDEDLLEAAALAVHEGRAGALQDLGAIYVMPPGALSAAGEGLLQALKERSPAYVELQDTALSPETSFILAPDPASEAREVVREVLTALEEGVPLQEVAVFHSADSAYGKLLRQAFQAAGVPVAPLPGVPLSETPAGKGLLKLLSLPDEDYRRSLVLDFLSLAPLKRWLPAGDGGRALAQAAFWDKISREAGVTRGREVWARRLQARLTDLELELRRAQIEDPERVDRIELERGAVADLLGVVQELVRRLEELRSPRRAAQFIAQFKSLINDYFDPTAPSLEDRAGGSSVLREIDQLGTVEAVGGHFGLDAFASALRANLEAAYGRETNLGEGVIVADYRVAAGLRFRRVILCCAFEGAFPAGPGGDPIISDIIWSRLRERHPLVEDATLRIERAREAAERAIGSAAEALTWSCPLFEPGGGREYYPSPLMVKAATERDPSIVTATQLRLTSSRGGWLRRVPSPLAGMLRGPATDWMEVGVRSAVLLKRRGAAMPLDHPRLRAVDVLRSRRGSQFTEWDGNVAGIDNRAWLELQRTLSPTSLENYAVCGFRYFCRSLLRLNVAEEPDEREMMDPAARGSLIHRVLERFYREAKEQGKLAPGARWSQVDRSRLLELADEEMEKARERGLTGLDVYGRHEKRTIRADLVRFLDADEELRLETGAVPERFEVDIPETDVAGVRLRGRADRVDITPDGQRAWVIDYKTGSLRGDEKRWDPASDPFMGGRKLQLPVYLLAVPEAREARALYWFITRKGGFTRREYIPTPENKGLFRRTIEAIVAGIRAGAFPAVSGDEDDYYGAWKNCRFCEYDRICSRRRDSEFEEKGNDPSMRPWLAVAEASRLGDSA